MAGLAGAASAQEQPWGQPLRWEEIDKPGINGEIILAPSEINRIAASHDIVYALDTANSRLHRSDNGGLTFHRNNGSSSECKRPAAARLRKSPLPPACRSMWPWSPITERGLHIR